MHFRVFLLRHVALLRAACCKQHPGAAGFGIGTIPDSGGRGHTERLNGRPSLIAGKACCRQREKDNDNESPRSALS